jgi:hypothetical protein
MKIYQMNKTWRNPVLARCRLMIMKVKPNLSLTTHKKKLEKRISSQMIFKGYGIMASFLFFRKAANIILEHRMESKR